MFVRPIQYWWDFATGIINLHLDQSCLLMIASSLWYHHVSNPSCRTRRCRVLIGPMLLASSGYQPAIGTLRHVCRGHNIVQAGFRKMHCITFLSDTVTGSVRSGNLIHFKLRTYCCSSMESQKSQILCQWASRNGLELGPLLPYFETILGHCEHKDVMNTVFGT